MAEITWRKYAQSGYYQSDMDAVVLLHAETEAALGRAMDLPDMMKAPVLETWVAERNGEILEGMYIEAIGEACFVGRNAEATFSAIHTAPELLENLRKRGLRVLRILVPRWIGKDADAIDRALKAAGFTTTDEEYRHYQFDLRRERGHS
jgi:hypothetical protein